MTRCGRNHIHDGDVCGCDGGHGDDHGGDGHVGDVVVCKRGCSSPYLPELFEEARVSGEMWTAFVLFVFCDYVLTGVHMAQYHHLSYHHLPPAADCLAGAHGNFLVQQSTSHE